MTSHARIVKDDSADLGFAWKCLLAGAISFEEFKVWAEHVVTITPSESLPPYMFDLMLAETRRDATVGLHDIVGFWPSDPMFEPTATGPGNAISGLTALRGDFCEDDAATTADAARKSLARHPEVLRRFSQVFPFLPVPQEAVE